MCGSPRGITGVQREKETRVLSERSNYRQCTKYILGYMFPDIFYKLYFCVIQRKLYLSFAVLMVRERNNRRNKRNNLLVRMPSKFLLVLE